MTPEQEKLIEGLKEFQEGLREDVEWPEEAALVSSAIAELERLIEENKRLKQALESRELREYIVEQMDKAKGKNVERYTAFAECLGIFTVYNLPSGGDAP